MLDTIRAKVEAGERLSAEEGEYLFRPEVDVHAVGRLADHVRRKKHGRAAWYNINVHLNPTNVCSYRCPLCAYRRDPKAQGAYVATRQEVVQRGMEAESVGATEVHIVSGMYRELGYDWYLDVIRTLHEAVPRVHLKAWTAAEIAWFSEITGRPIRAILQEMIAAGVGSMPGGGAEIFAPEVRRRIAPGKLDGPTWLEVHRTAHELGLRTNATMLYGHVESPADRIDHMVRLRELQDHTGGFQAFIPLAFHPYGTRLNGLRRTSALDDLRTVAVARLMLDNFDHIKAYWVSLGVGTAQVALAYGADDFDGTVRHEAIHHEAGATSPDSLSVDELRYLIAEAGFEPVERDTLYRPVRRVGNSWYVE